MADTENAALCAAPLAAAEPIIIGDTQAKAPEWVMLFPNAPRLRARDGREWQADFPALCAAFSAHKAFLPVDYEHGQDHLAPKGIAAPAAGWIEALEARPDGLYARVEWTKAGRKSVEEKEYRYISPAFTHRAGRMLRLQGAALVNRPALELPALAREQPLTEENAMNLTAIAAALGLEQNAGEKDILAAIAKNKETRSAEAKALCRALAVADDSSAADLIKAAQAARAEAAEAAAKAKAPETEQTALAAMQRQLEAGKKEMAEMKAALREKEVDSFLDSAAAAGKIMPAARAEYKALCADESGFAACRNLVAKLPAALSPSGLDGKTAAEPDYDPQLVALCANKYQDEQAALGRNISASQAVDYILANPDRLK